MARKINPISKAQSAALALFAADMLTVDVRAATINSLLARGFLMLVPVPANNGLHRAVITQAGRDAAFSSLIAA